MVTFVSNVAATTGGQAAQAATKSVELSQMAEKALSQLGQMQTGMSDTMARMESQAATAADPARGTGIEPGGMRADGSGSNGMQDSLGRTAEMMALTARIQSQLLQFSMATSVSSNMGRNLNTFLKGQ